MFDSWCFSNCVFTWATKGLFILKNIRLHRKNASSNPILLVERIWFSSLWSLSFLDVEQCDGIQLVQPFWMWTCILSMAFCAAGLITGRPLNVCCDHLRWKPARFWSIVSVSGVGLTLFSPKSCGCLKISPYSFAIPLLNRTSCDKAFVKRCTAWNKSSFTGTSGNIVENMPFHLQQLSMMIPCILTPFKSNLIFKLKNTSFTSSKDSPRVNLQWRICPHSHSFRTFE